MKEDKKDLDNKENIKENNSDMEEQITEIPELKIDEDLLNIDNIKSNKKKDIKKEDNLEKNENKNQKEEVKNNEIKETEEKKKNDLNDDKNELNIKKEIENKTENEKDSSNKDINIKKEDDTTQITDEKKDENNKNNENKDNITNLKEKNTDNNQNEIEKKEEESNIKIENKELNQENKKEGGGVKRSAIQGKLNKFRKQFGKKKKTSSTVEPVKENDNSNIKSDLKNDNDSNVKENENSKTELKKENTLNIDEIINNNSNQNNNNNSNNINNINKKEIINNKNNDISRTNTLEEMFKKKIEDGFDTETNNILDLGINHNNNKDSNILNEIQNKLGINFNELNTNNNDNDINNINKDNDNNQNNNTNGNTDNNKEKDIIKDSDKKVNIFDTNAHDSNKYINPDDRPIRPSTSNKFIDPDDRPIHPSSSNNFNFDLDFDEQEKIFNKEIYNKNKERPIKKTNSNRTKNIFEDKDLELLGKKNSIKKNSSNKKAEIESKNKDNREINPFNIDNMGESNKIKDENEIDNINNAINNLNNTLNNLENLNTAKTAKKNDDDERRPKIKIDDFQKKLELALEQEQSDLGNKDNENKKENENGNEDNNKNKEDPRFDSIKEKLGKEIVDSLMSKKWESKKHGFELINQYLESNSLNEINSNDLYEYIRLKLKNFKETNFNVNREAINVFITMSEKKFINKENLITIILAYYDKITDPKLKENYIELFNSSLTHVDQNSLLKQVLMKISKKNNAKLLIEYSLLFGKIIDEYNNRDLPYKELTDFCKIMANNNNPQSRNGATNLICILYKYYGEEIHKLIKDIKESTLKNIEAEMSKITIIERKNTTKSKKSNKKLNLENLNNGNLNGGEKELNGGVNNETKTNIVNDISKKITPQLLKSISDGKWAEKKEACEQIEKILIDSNMKILPNGLNDLMNLIKKKLLDGNKNIVRMMVNLLTQLIEALKQGFKQWSKYIALNMIPNLSDKNQILRNECQICFDKWVEYVGFDTLIIYFPPFLKTDNVEIRTEIMNFIKKYKNKFNKEIGISVFKELVPNLLLCLQDRSSSVRAQSEEIIKLSLNYIKLNNYYTKIKEYKPAITNDLQIILDKIQNEINGNNSNENETNTNTNTNNSNIKDNKDKNKDDFDIENEDNIKINELMESNNKKNNGNGATTHRNNHKNNTTKKTDDSSYLKANSTILNTGNNLETNSKISINENKKFKKQLNQSKNRKSANLNNSISSDISHKNKDKDSHEKANKTKELTAMKSNYKTCSNFNKKKTAEKDSSSIMKSARKESSKTKLLKSVEKKKFEEKSEKSLLTKSTSKANENPKTDRTQTTKKLGITSKIKGISNSLILKKNERNKKEGNSIFLSNVKVTPNKLKRLEKDMKFKFSLEFICRDISVKSKLKETCKNLFTEDFHKKIFSDDFKKQVMALKEMKEQIDKNINIPIYFDNLDLILKVYGINLNGNLNPTLVKNLFEFLDSLYNIITEKGHVLNEIESNIIISLLIDKLSINNNTLKEHLILLLSEYIELNDINKTMILVLNIALGKNSKIKTDILDYTIELYLNQKLNIMSKNYIKILGKYMCLNDNLVKSKVLILIKEIFNEIGEELFIILDFLTDKDKQFLENNLFNDNNNDFDDEEEEVEINTRHYLGMNSSDDEYEDINQNTENENHENHENLGNNGNKENKGNNEIININTIINSKKNNKHTNIANGAVNSEDELLSILNYLLSKDLNVRNNTIILLHDIIYQKYEENKNIIIPNIDRIIDIFIQVTHELFIDSDIYTIPAKFAKYISTVLLKLASKKELISKISYNIIFKLTIELLNYLLINDLNKIGTNEEGNIIFKSINSTMLRIIDNCDKTSVIRVLLEIIKNYQKNEDIKMGSLATKCLLKSIENLPHFINDLDLIKIFNDLHLIVVNFEKRYPELKNKNQTDSLILKFIKTFIANVTNLKEDCIFEIYSNSISKSEIEDKYIIHWIKACIENKNNKNDKTMNQSINNNDSINNSINISNEINKDKEKKIEEKKEDINDKDNNNTKKDKNNKNDINNNKKEKGSNTIDQLKKKWNDVKK